MWKKILKNEVIAVMDMLISWIALDESSEVESTVNDSTFPNEHRVYIMYTLRYA
jgi:hypothetical protein